MEALYIPHVGARRKLDSLPILGKDLFGEKFQEILEAEAKRIDTVDKLNLKKPPATHKSGPAGKKVNKSAPTFRPTFRKPFKAFC